MMRIEFGTVFNSTDGQSRVVVDVGDDSLDASIETLGIISFEPLLITHMSSSAAPFYIAELLDIVLSVDDVIMGISKNNDGIHESYEKLLIEYASRGKTRTISF